MTESETIKRIKSQLAMNPVVLYMKGSPFQPRCGFSARVVEILNELKVQYAYVDVLVNPAIRAELPNYSNWPTFPQLYIHSELIGGCDIVTTLHQTNQLLSRLEPIGVVQSQAVVPCLASE